MKLGLISLGCAKNKVDSELFLGLAKKYGLQITSNVNFADIIVINTCGFIEDAKQESIDTILDMIEYQKEGKTIVVMGCLVERYLDELKESIPEVDYFIPIKNYKELHTFFQNLMLTDDLYKFNFTNRILSTPKGSAYLRIGEGCSNKCAYCAIPLIRGEYISRPFDEIMEEAKLLAEDGVKELTIIAQDTSKYGTDLENMSLAKLLSSIAELNAFKWIRVLYMYPDEITEELLDVFEKYDCIVKYFDIPIQHASNRLLTLMNRRGTKEMIADLISTIRKRIPTAIIRTTLIVGFPTETTKDFNELLTFVKETKFEHLGVFTYSDEDDTEGFKITPKVTKKTMDKRRDEIMLAQMNINDERLSKLINKTFTSILDHYDPEIKAYALRYYAQALDDADGYIYVEKATLSKALEVGQFYDVTICGVDGYDLIGKIKDLQA